MQSFEGGDMVASLMDNGYLLLRNYLPEPPIELIVNHLKARGYCDNTLTVIKSNPDLMAQQEWIQNNIMEYLEHPRLAMLFDHLLKGVYQCTVTTPIKFKWLRAVGTGLFTGLHCDNVYIGHISPRTLTAWLPLSPVPKHKGSLIVFPKSHSNEQWRSIRQTYSLLRVGEDGTTSGWLAPNLDNLHSLLGLPEETEVEWVTTDFNPGDVCILHPFLMHMTGENLSNEWRVSCDVRWVGL
jgi:hypothetical protein